MRVTGVETLRLDEHPNLLYLRVHTDEGLVGLGETFFGAQAVEAHVHETVAPYLLGRDPLLIDRHNRALAGYVGYAGTGVETRAASAVDLALWDLLGKATGRPLVQLLGGASRDRVRVYNTCAGYQYVRRPSGQAVDNWGLASEPAGPYEDLDAFLHRADELALSLLDEGFTGMKIWPFDPYAESSGGQHITPGDLARALEPFEKIRSAVGSRMEIMVELHGLWNLPAARTIARALEDFEPTWLEDPIRPDSTAALAALADSTSTPIAASETLGGTTAFLDLVAGGGADIVIADASWAGGITRVKALASIAEAHKLPVTMHDCSGPVVFAASASLAVQLPNSFIQETVRAYYRGWYSDIVTELPPLSDGWLQAPSGPGLGIDLQPDLARRAGTHVRMSEG